MNTGFHNEDEVRSRLRNGESIRQIAVKLNIPRCDVRETADKIKKETTWDNVLALLVVVPFLIALGLYIFSPEFRNYFNSLFG